jgi:hypothetical protein
VFVDGMGVFIVKVGTILGLAERFSHYKKCYQNQEFFLEEGGLTRRQKQKWHQHKQ